MAPYVTKVEIVNWSEYKINWIGASTLKNLDGKTSVNGMEILSGQTMSTDITKSGGTDGLFTTLAWTVAHAHWDVKSQWCIYCEMPAAAGRGVFLGLRDIWGMSHPQFTQSTATDYNENQGKQYNVWNNPVVRNGTIVNMEPVRQEFPHSHVRITITQEFDPSSIGSKMGTFEGKRVRSPDGRLWLCLGKQLRYIQDMDTYGGMFGGNYSLWNLSQAVTDAMPKGPTLNTKPPLIKPSGSDAVYFVDDGKKRWIENPDTFNRYGFDWGRIVTSDAEAGKYPDGNSIK